MSDPAARDAERPATHRDQRGGRALVAALVVVVSAVMVTLMLHIDVLGLPTWLRAVAGVAAGLAASWPAWAVLTRWLATGEGEASDAETVPDPMSDDPATDADPEPDNPDIEAGAGLDGVTDVDPARWRDVDVDRSDPRALVLLVRSLEATLEEQHLVLTALRERDPVVAERTPVSTDPPAAVLAAPAPETELGPRRTQLVMEALSHLQGPSASARVDAAIGRLGAPTLFVRPPLAAFLPRPELPVSAPAIVDDGAAEAAAVPPAPVPEPEDDVVLPVPARKTVEAAPRRRRLFRSHAA